MERAGFILTVGAGLMTCILLGWQGYEGARADWVSGFLCVLWSLLMLARLMILTAPSPANIQHSHLAQKIIGAFYASEERRRQDVLRQSFGVSFAVFLLLGFAFALWQVFCAVFPANDYAMSGFLGAVQDFFAAAGTAPLIAQPQVFEWGQGFLFLLCLSMMGFLLRSYSSQIRTTRVVLLVLASYVAAGWITFFGLSLGTGRMPLEPHLVGYGSAIAAMVPGTSLFERLVMESGILGIALMAFILFVPLGFIWLSLHHPQRDWIVIGCGTLAVISLLGCVFLSLNPALGGFVFLCWMAVFLAWGASESRMQTLA